jgi:hypothetical protein
MIVVAIVLASHALFTFDKAEVMVEWTTASEIDTIGFNLLRSETPVGPFEQVNLELIPASTDPFRGSSYNFKDHNVLASVNYYYMLEEVESSGMTNQHGPIVVVASRAAMFELIIAGVLIGLAVIVGFIFLRKPKKLGKLVRNV